jgi:uncharacterized membrane protein YozB (DUF420 family)
MEISGLPAINAFLNTISAILLIIGYVYIKKKRADIHKKIMLFALAVSAIFLITYLIYHKMVGSVPYQRQDWTRPLYFAVLIPHIVLAGFNVPFILMAVWFALRGKIERHKRVVRWLWPSWIFVSISGIVVYLMLYGR